MTENWQPVTGWEGLYEVSDQGRVRSFDRVDRLGRRRRGRVLSLFVNNHGYLSVCLADGSRRGPRSVHNLVIEAFKGPRLNGYVVRHGPGGQHDNRICNLSYGTHSQNESDKHRDGTVRLGEQNPNSKLDVDKVLYGVALYRQGKSLREVSNILKISPTTVHQIVTGKTWNHVTNL